MQATRRKVSLLLLVLAALVAISPAAASLPKLPALLQQDQLHQVDVDRLEAAVLDDAQASDPLPEELAESSRFSLWWPPPEPPGELLTRALVDTSELARVSEIAPSELPSLPETRVRAFALFGPESQPASNRVSRGEASRFGLGLLENGVGHATPSLYAFVGHVPNMATDPRGLVTQVTVTSSGKAVPDRDVNGTELYAQLAPVVGAEEASRLVIEAGMGADIGADKTAAMAPYIVAAGELSTRLYAGSVGAGVCAGFAGVAAASYGLGYVATNFVVGAAAGLGNQAGADAAAGQVSSSSAYGMSMAQGVGFSFAFSGLSMGVSRAVNGPGGSLSINPSTSPNAPPAPAEPPPGVDLPPGWRARFLVDPQGQTVDLGPRVNTNQRPVVIGENMAGRVKPAAAALGADVFLPPEGLSGVQLKAYNRYWINEQMNQCRGIIDAGPDPGPFRLRPNYPEVSSDYFQIERDAIRERDYPFYTQYQPPQ